jgi:hypothetical protein
VGAAETDRQIIQKVTILWRSGSTLSTRSGSNEVAYASLRISFAFIVIGQPGYLDISFTISRSHIAKFLL